MPDPTVADDETLRAWVRDVQHDLIKYLEMMPRSMDWDHLDPDDGEMLFEAIRETRTSASGSMSALAIWQMNHRTLTEAHQNTDEIRSSMEALIALDELADGLEGALSAATAVAIRALIFIPGERLAALRKRLTPA